MWLRFQGGIKRLLNEPSTQAFAVVAGLEALVRGLTLSVFPLVLYRAWGSATVVSEIYLVIGILSLLIALSVPAFARLVSRRKAYLGAVACYVLSALCGMLGGKWVTSALFFHATAAATAFVCFNAYVLDYVDRSDFSRLESLRMLYGGAGWVVGPMLGVWLLAQSPKAPFVAVAIAASAMWLAINHIPLGNGRQIATHRDRAVHPLANIRRFVAQPRLVAGWFFAVMRSCGWWFYFVYVGIFAVENGLGDSIGGIAASAANMGLFLAPMMFRWMKTKSVRHAVRLGSLGAAICFILGASLWKWPWVTLLFLMLGTLFLVLLDVAANLPFMLAVKPSERSEMSSVFSSFRDTSGIVSPGIAWLVLLVSPVGGVYFASGAGLLLAWWVAGKLHPKLGMRRTSPMVASPRQIKRGDA